MVKHILYFAVVCWAAVFFAAGLFAEESAWEDIGDGHLNVTAVIVDPRQPQNILFGTEKGIFRSTDGGKNWTSALSLNGHNQWVRSFIYGQEPGQAVYAATGNGLFQSTDQAKSWTKIFQGNGFLEKDCRAVAVCADALYLGTKGGLFISTDRGKTWNKETGEPGNSPVLSITVSSKPATVIYVACVSGLFRLEPPNRDCEKVFSAFSYESEQDDIEDNETQELEPEVSAIRYAAIDPQNNNRVYLACASGVYLTENSGKTWRRLTDQGLLKKEVKNLALNFNSELYCSTENGLYFFRQDSWQDLSPGLTCGRINSFFIDKRAKIYAASSRGLFRSAGSGPDGSISTGKNKDLSDDGPSVSELQRAAMKFAEVEPEKISAWRRAAARKAWLPQMNLGLNRSTTDLWHWESGSTTKECDDILRKGHDSLDWDISLSWDLGDIVWSEAQNSIDVRSRLSVQLRNDILDEVTKLYFERIRVKEELVELDILDKKKRQDKQLRIRELSAYLDGLTGGYFSAKLKK
jgi:photosystem II stability/assembly factor-like uncharacterized protein